MARLQPLENLRVLRRPRLSGGPRMILPLPAGEGRGEGEPWGNQFWPVWTKTMAVRFSLTLDPSPAGRGRQPADASGLGSAGLHFSVLDRTDERRGISLLPAGEAGRFFPQQPLQIGVLQPSVAKPQFRSTSGTAAAADVGD